MRVLHLLKTSEGATWGYRQTRELVNLGVEVHAALPSGGGSFGSYSKAGVVVHDMQLSFSPKHFHKQVSELRRLVREVQPDLIHSHFVGTTITMRLALGKRGKIPRVFQVPGPLHLEHPFFRTSEILLAGPNDFWIASSTKTLEYYQKSGVQRNKLFLSYYGVDLENFTDTSANPSLLRQLADIPETTKVVGMVAFMYAPKPYLGQKRGLKGHEDLIDAIALCLAKGYDVTAVFVGGAWNGAVAYEAAIKNYANKRLGNRAVFLGTRKDVADLYKSFDIAAQPSHSENIGGALESLLSCVPTVATNVGGVPDLVRAGETGWLVPAKNPKALAGAIMEALDKPNLAHRLAQKGRERAASMFDMRQNARDVYNAYQSILG